MSYAIRNGRVMKQIFVTGIYGPNEGWVDCGPVPPTTRKDRAFWAVQYFERKGRLGCKWCQIARAIFLSVI